MTAGRVLREQMPGPWSLDAACIDMPNELFYPKEGRSDTRVSPDYDDGKRVCASCDVRLQCLNFALETKQEYGLWGGLAPSERRVVLRRRRRDAARRGVS